ncbi:EamA family transporter RarD [Antarcticirhabdus aurantiaca]|uniref:EamA family transporter RarD n=1 Tax=Antarcticirhabdus aurantiaca TaxID=2606717 RepID=A0ACD4NU44_9HYPH|nr:EamA family transporter RarD [Antarcticirhabdus aurantiaca]WAJ30436.1 EamA family transporter RarD [Jeongeuplla avenae]
MQSSDPEPRLGFLYAGGAYLLWGLVLPMYLKMLGHVSPLEVVAHRILWSIPFAVALLWHQGLLRRAVGLLADPRTLGLAAITATLISVNWSTYVYAIAEHRAVEAALGYYINPLVNVALAAIFLGERPTRVQLGAIALATTGVVILTLSVGTLPWISLVLALTFGTYGLIRKVVPAGASEGFFLEVAILAVPALIVLAVFVTQPHFGRNALETALLVGAGPLTAIPLILFAAGARLLHFSTIGLMQYAVPTLLFLTAVFIFGEPFTGAQLVSFAFIWAALALYTTTLIAARRRRTAAVQAAGGTG